MIYLPEGRKIAIKAISIGGINKFLKLGKKKQGGLSPKIKYFFYYVILKRIYNNNGV